MATGYRYAISQWAKLPGLAERDEMKRGPANGPLFFVFSDCSANIFQPGIFPL